MRYMHSQLCDTEVLVESKINMYFICRLSAAAAELPGHVHNPPGCPSAIPPETLPESRNPAPSRSTRSSKTEPDGTP